MGHQASILGNRNFRAEVWLLKTVKN
jgi:hypothetical protein